ncbi:MAG: hypothetical protein FD165_1908 [Gammaproteobacteria bacterium]|nr:MAG: hypothetical protein FD165_1908 [Gammaproteobacteria bacterium]TND04480.1 MAG: hypothetical protein FD120_1594 [Gammaproteobacteria bacterium]
MHGHVTGTDRRITTPSAGASTLINLPNRDRFEQLAREIFASGWLTNNGPMVRELEERLADYLGVEYLVLTSSGTLALQVALHALGVSGSVVTSPFSWVTTVSSLAWLGLTPLFADIDARTYNIDPRKIEAAITGNTRAILATHTFGNPCDIEAIDQIAARRGLLCIYDAAHAFGVDYLDRSVLACGDASVLSLHATKLFHTVEGGAVVLRDAEHCRRARLAVNNGQAADGQVQAPGINGRLSELHAAVGLCLLDDIDAVMTHRRQSAEKLRLLLASSATGLQQFNPLARVNHAFFPVVFPTPELRETAMAALTSAGFIPHIYFDPTLNRLPFIGSGPAMPVAEALSKRILCLPLLTAVSQEELAAMAEIIAGICPLEEYSARKTCA